jgi:DNA repair protein RadC
VGPDRYLHNQNQPVKNWPIVFNLPMSAGRLSTFNFQLKILPLSPMSIKLSATQKTKPIYTAADVWSIIHPIHIRENKMRRQREYFWILAIDRERHLKAAELLAIGSDNRVHIKPADAFRMAIYKNADYVIFIHNHPKGKLDPSTSDKDTTDRLIKAGEVVDIKVVDHFIINEKGFFSFVPN